MQDVLSLPGQCSWYPSILLRMLSMSPRLSAKNLGPSACSGSQERLVLHVQPWSLCPFLPCNLLGFTGFYFSPGKSSPSPCVLQADPAPLMGYFLRINNHSPLFDSSLRECRLLYHSPGLYLWDSGRRDHSLLVRGHPEEMCGNEIWVSQREHSFRGA